jgi:hypothetical protein
MVGTPTSRRAIYYFADYEESEDQGRQRITRQHVTVPKTVPTLFERPIMKFCLPFGVPIDYFLYKMD